VSKPKWFPNGLYCNRCGKQAPIILGWHNPDFQEHDNPDALVCTQCFEELGMIRRELAKGLLKG
jgi:hypothetical protein